MNIDLTVSVILPTLNEGKNLEILIPDLIKNLNSIKNLQYEIIVVDDGSTDDTFKILKNKDFEENVILINRNGKPSLPMSLYEGINNSKYEYVAWLDADGSMPANILLEMVKLQMANNLNVIVGSRFVEGGGYKGIKQLEKTSIFSAIRNVYNSNDSVLGMIVSTLFNKFLILLLNVDVRDITSGFIIGKKEYFVEEIFSQADYGDYFIYLVFEMQKKGINILEHGYVCETRIHGVSKTSTNILQLIKRGIPYIKAANNCRKASK